jgi:hypothetical protein
LHDGHKYTNIPFAFTTRAYNGSPMRLTNAIDVCTFLDLEQLNICSDTGIYPYLFLSLRLIFAQLLLLLLSVAYVFSPTSLYIAMKEDSVAARIRNSFEFLCFA